MTVRELIDFYLDVRQPGGLIGFEQIYEEEFERLKQAIQEHYGSQERWLDLPEETELPGEITRRAARLQDMFQGWMNDGEA